MSADDRLVFDRALWRRRRDRAAAGGEGFGRLHREVCDSLGERLGEIQRTHPAGLVLGTGRGCFSAALRGRFGIQFLVQADASEAMAARASVEVPEAAALVVDEEALPFAAGSFDLAVAGLTLHWANDPVGVLVQLCRALRPDGLFLGAMFAGETLWELRDSLAAAEIEVTGGLSPRVAPMGELRDLGGLLQRAGFALPVADIDRYRFGFADPVTLMRQLRGMGETNVMRMRGGGLTRALLARAGEIYSERHPHPEGGIAATFEIAYLTGWAPHPDQQQPLRPGQSETRLADALGAEEIPLEPTGRR